MNPSPFDGSLDGPSSPVVAPQERNTALYSHRQSAPGVQPQIRVPPRGPGEVLFIFWALSRSTLENPRFAVGLELFTRVERWAKPPWRQEASVSRIHLEPIATVLLLQSCFRLQQAGRVSRDPPRN